MYKTGDEEMVFCPYNRYHTVSKLRIQKHILKCKKNYPDVKLATCFYNYTHRLRPEDMLEHYEICSQKTRIDGAKYSEPCCLNPSNSSVKSVSVAETFPDINVKPRVFTEPGASSSQILRESGETDSSWSDSENDYMQKIGVDNDSDKDLEPLPLPKTVSKAFVYVEQKPVNLTSDRSKPKTFGRGKNFFPFSSSKLCSTSDLVSDLSAKETVTKEQDDVPVFFSKGNSTCVSSSILKYNDTLKSPFKFLLKTSSASITSSMFDDISTLKSEEIISDEESAEEDNGNNDFIFSNFDKYVRIQETSRKHNEK